MRTYVINLADSKERLANTSEVLKDTPLRDFTRFEAFDARNLSSAELHRIFDYDGFEKIHNREPRPGEIGCAVSHSSLWQKIFEDSSNALILEDDISLPGELPTDLLEAVDNWMTVDMPRVLMLSDSNICVKSSFSEIRGHNSKGEEVCFTIARPVVCQGGYAYIVNPAAARRLVEIWKRNTVTDNWMLFSRNGVDVRCLVPALISPGDGRFGSTIAKTDAERHDTNFSLSERAVLKAQNLWEQLMLRLGIWVRV